MLKNTVLYEEKQLKIGIFSRPVGMKVANIRYCSRMVVVDVLIYLNFGHHLGKYIFPFQRAPAEWIGDTRQLGTNNNHAPTAAPDPTFYIKSALDNRQPITNSYNHRLNMELDLQSLFGLHVLSCTHWLRQHPSPRIWLTNRAIIYAPKCGGGGDCGVSANEMSTAVHMEPK